jgi:membrane fusion protein (multidrug efflux system)
MNVSAHLDFPATMQGVQVVEIRPMISGYVGTIGVQEGSTVRKGQLLFTIDNPQYAQTVCSEEAAVASAEATMATAEQNVTKVKPLVEEGIVSKFELTSAENTLEADRAALAQAKAALQNARVNLAYTVIRSPLDGVIGTIPYKTGALVGTTSTEALTTLSDISQVYAYFSLDEKQLLQLLNDDDNTSTQEKLNRIPPVSLVLANGAVYPLKGKLQTASGLVTTSTGSTSFKALFANPHGLIRSGSSAILRIPRRYDSALVVPQSATSEIQDKKLVYIVVAGNKVHPVAITGTPTDDGKFYIVTNGLSVGDHIVLNGISSLRDSLTIKPVDVSPDSVYSQLKAEQ